MPCFRKNIMMTKMILMIMIIVMMMLRFLNVFWMNSWQDFGYITYVMCQYEYLISYSLDSWGMSSLKCTRSSYKVWRTLKAFKMNSWWNFGFITCAMFLYVDLVSCNRCLKWRANMPHPRVRIPLQTPGSLGFSRTWT